MATYVIRKDDLQHHGILGMKWGVRRTKAQLAKAKGKVEKLEDKLAEKTSNPTSLTSKPKSKTVSDMSDEELRKRVNRLNLEKQYKDLTPETISKGRKFMKTVMKQVVIPAATEVGRNTLKTILTDAVNKQLSKQKS